jgi:hypothetical protein
VREKLNENPIAQVGLILVLVVVGAVVFLGGSGGGEEEESAPTEATVAVAGTSAVGTATGATPGEAVEGAVESAIETVGEAGAVSAVPTSVPTPPPPAAVTAAYDADKTVVLLIVHDGGIDDRLVKEASSQLASVSEVALFTVSAKQIYRYASITIGLDVNRVPALVVMRPKRLSDGTPQASVDYGFQTSQGVLQAVRDAAYDGREVTYHPN